jgi:hypothetical protein
MLEWSQGTWPEEVAATIIARFAGFPVPRIISYDDHPDVPHALVSILITRIPGKDLVDPDLYEGMAGDEQGIVFAELQCILHVMRKWSHPWGKEQICSVLGYSSRQHAHP